MNQINRKFDLPGKPGPKTLAGVVGAVCCAILLATVPQHEGKRNTTYRDPVGIPTACYGDTRNVVLGQTYSDSECLQRLNSQLIDHAEPVLACTPQIAGTTYQLAAAVSFAYNVGAGAYCSSSIARAFRAGDDATACKRFNEKPDGSPQWIYAKGRVLPGLVKRRADERALCERGLR